MQFSTRRSVGKRILLTGLIAGTLDILDALIFFGLRFHVAPVRLLQNIAGHLIGRVAFAEGVPAALLGLALHYLIATIWAAIFILAARRLPVLARQAIVSGILYGLFVYLVMNYVVLPHTLLYAHPSHDPIVLLNAVLALILFIGLPISLLNRNA